MPFIVMEIECKYPLCPLAPRSVLDEVLVTQKEPNVGISGVVCFIHD